MTAVETEAESAAATFARPASRAARSSVGTIIAASMVGTTIEFYDFYAYGTAAANYFPHVFFSRPSRCCSRSSRSPSRSSRGRSVRSSSGILAIRSGARRRSSSHS